ncbi:Cysteine desulfurase IscS 2 [Candidatus Lokiarchaeum ossiferum]|uniref:cysteine desulfurase n=1 Tax=Candidatus Lokiarchaeum ossiferum TaxID=2951803 RepID=A0ABY6HYR9_9ARCH|nr:Cysteine desulfurase IscS 2 [Candidatus Lokiarchaeum sp. B-35]
MSNSSRIYFDYNATTPVHPEVVDIMNKYYLEDFGNPGSVHEFGLDAHEGLIHARKTISHFIGASPTEIIITSGGSEADNLALQGVMYKYREMHPDVVPHLIIDTIEHPAVWETANFLEREGFEVTRIPVDREGLVNPQDVKEAIKPNTALISIMYANNETGTINPISEIGKIAHDHHVLFHTDAVQAITKVPINVNEENIDLLSVSAHKFYGPKGVGFLYVKNAPSAQNYECTASQLLRPLMYGGSQEFSLRPATENVAGIVGMGKALEIAQNDFDVEYQRLTHIRNRLIKEILETIPDTKLNGSLKSRIPNNINICFKGVFAYDLMVELDNHHIACSVGAACHAGETKPSRVLMGIGLSEDEAASSLRFSIGRWTTDEHVDQLLSNLKEFVPKLRTK